MYLLDAFIQSVSECHVHTHLVHTNKVANLVAFVAHSVNGNVLFFSLFIVVLKAKRHL